MTEPVKVLFLCTGNSCRSQMAEGLANYMGGGRVAAFSAGVNPAGKVAETAIKVMAEVGIDISGQISEGVDSYTGQPFDWVITLCDHANQVCPIWTGMGIRLHWSIPDPYDVVGNAEAHLRGYRESRDLIFRKLLDWFREIGIQPVEPPVKIGL